MKFRLNKTVAAVSSSALLLMAVPAIGFATASSAASKPTFTIGYEGPLSGGNAQLGINMKWGVELAIQDANATGKLPFKLQAAWFDDQGSSTLSPAAAQAAVANKSLVAVVGPAFSGATRSAEPFYVAANIATVSPSATAAALTTGKVKNNFMRVVYGDDVQGAADARFLVVNRHNKKIEVIGDGSFYGAGLAAVVAADAKTYGAKVTTESYPESSSCPPGTAPTSQYTALATQIKTSNPGAVFYGGYYCDFGLLLGALHSAGYKGAIMSGDGSESTSLISGTSPKTAANGVFLSAAGGGSGGNFTGALESQFLKISGGVTSATALYAPQAYDATNAIVRALLKVSTKVPVSKIRASLIPALHTVRFSGVTGTIAFQSDGNLAGTGAGQIDYYQVKNGKIVQFGHN
ncbi:MAG: branched-chain amino acid ABC transporter substrate-binding protein [Actinomycetota bacterium]|nr:branched-chain amino acid ABC transporter substrate-binding protein [Actinomycetota bacterium]